MNALQPTTEPQQLLFIPRHNSQTVYVELVNELTDLSVTYEFDTVYSDGFMNVPIAHNFSEGENYQYEVTDLTGNLMYRGKIFITGQSNLQNYNTHNDILSI
ncbi:hypothetical protein LCGC14_1395730 [marine sediment metagenome]|uniref:Uncharacterized protein n=2 Tax=root TaxID=1 RepID=A0A831QQE1_9FLAO|nr:hypothetical protein [Pricia sp.]HEA22745.1 hypothetical protein [Pricia antarctica]